jgi:hypothetical protein
MIMILVTKIIEKKRPGRRWDRYSCLSHLLWTKPNADRISALHLALLDGILNENVSKEQYHFSVDILEKIPVWCTGSCSSSDFGEQEIHIETYISLKSSFYCGKSLKGMKPITQEKISG